MKCALSCDIAAAGLSKGMAFSIIFVQMFKEGIQPEAGAGSYLIVATTLFMLIIITKHKR